MIGSFSCTRLFCSFLLVFTGVFSLNLLLSVPLAPDAQRGRRGFGIHMPPPARSRRLLLRVFASRISGPTILLFRAHATVLERDCDLVEEDPGLSAELASKELLTHCDPVEVSFPPSPSSLLPVSFALVGERDYVSVGRHFPRSPDSRSLSAFPFSAAAPGITAAFQHVIACGVRTVTRMKSLS